MRKEIVFTFLLALLTVGFFSCEKSDSGNSGPTTLGVKIEAINKSFSLPVSSGTKSAAIGSESITWDSVHLVVSNLKFEAELKSQVSHEDSIEISYKWTGPELINLLDSNLSLGSFVLQPGFYDEIELKVSGDKEDAGDNPVFYLEGTYTGTNSTLPIMVKVNQDVAFKSEQENVEITEESIEFFTYIQFYLDQLMAEVDPVDLENAQLSEGIIVISADSNSELYHTILGNLVKDRHGYHKHKHHDDKYEHKDYDDHDDDD